MADSIKLKIANALLICVVAVALLLELLGLVNTAVLVAIVAISVVLIVLRYVYWENEVKRHAPSKKMLWLCRVFFALAVVFFLLELGFTNISFNLSSFMTLLSITCISIYFFYADKLDSSSSKST